MGRSIYLENFQNCVHTNLISEKKFSTNSSRLFSSIWKFLFAPKIWFQIFFFLIFSEFIGWRFFKVRSGHVKNYFFIFTHSKVNVQCQKSRFIRKKYFSFDATIMIYWRVPLPNLGNPSDKCLYYITFQFF